MGEIAMQKNEKGKRYVATMTFHMAHNYGAMLQAYALEQAVNQIGGVSCEIIDYRFPFIDKWNGIQTFPELVQKYGIIIGSLKYINRTLRGSYKRIAPLHRKFNRFMRRNLILSQKVYYDAEELKTVDYDVILLGSDQIWNTTARDFSEAFFLPGISKKSTYAVSCGSHLNEVDCDRICSAMETFENVSVREIDTREFLEKHTKRSIETVLDPTFLLTKEDYSGLYDKERILKEKYIFFYTINYDEDALKQTVRVAERLGGCKIVTPFTGYSAIKAKKYGIKVMWDVAPDAFLNLIENAECVCSNSFHGIAFSIIFKKEFYRVGAMDQTGKIKKDDRIDNILNWCGLSNRNYGETNGNRKIDYIQVEHTLNALRNRSNQYIYNMLVN